MKKKEEISRLDKLWKKMKKHIKAFLDSGDQEELHQFRVQVKKIKAMLTLYEAEPENKGLLKKFKSVKKIFKTAGDIRNAYVNLQLSKDHQLNDPKFNEHQQQILDKGSKDFRKKGKKYLKKIKKACIVLQNDIAQLKNKSVRSFYHDKLTQIESFFNDPVFNDELHNTRKKIKLLLYNQKVAGKALKDKVHINHDYLDQLQSCIGEWHDHNLAIDVLSNIGEAENQAINDIKNSNANLEKKILEQSGNFKEKVIAAEDEPVKK